VWGRDRSPRPAGLSVWPWSGAARGGVSFAGPIVMRPAESPPKRVTRGDKGPGGEQADGVARHG
jgi:hypothetical protein